MSCSCQKMPDSERTGVTPYSPCERCAKKHVVAAWAAWHELSHEADNRDYCSGNLRLAAEHLAGIDRSLAMRCRDVAVRIEDFDDFDGDRPIADDLDSLRRLLWELGRNLPPWETELPDVTSDDGLETDLIVPLGYGSKSSDDELKIMLRSAERNALGLGRVIVVSDHVPGWLDVSQVVLVDEGDHFLHNKDANLIVKTLKAIDQCAVERFCWCSDDCAFNLPIRLSRIPLLISSRDRSEFSGESVWHRRVRNTFSWAESLGVRLESTYDVHCPQFFDDAATLSRRMKEVDFETEPGLTIMTAFRVVMGETEGALRQPAWKNTVEGNFSDGRSQELGRHFIGYNDRGFATGLREWLFRKFPEKSRFEL